MSRIGKQPVSIPSGVTVTSEADGNIVIKGPKGELKLNPHPLAKVEVSDQEIVVIRDGEEPQKRAIQGLTRSLLQNMVTGVTEGFSKRLEVNGVGYRAKVQGKILELSLGFSHPIKYSIPEGIEVTMDEEKKNVIIISGVDKQKVGQAAAEIRSYRKPEPYKGKGVKYEDEHIHRKAGKTAAKSSS